MASHLRSTARLGPAAHRTISSRAQGRRSRRYRRVARRGRHLRCPGPGRRSRRTADRDRRSAASRSRARSCRGGRRGRRHGARPRCSRAGRSSFPRRPGDDPGQAFHLLQRARELAHPGAGDLSLPCCGQCDVGGERGVTCDLVESRGDADVVGVTGRHLSGVEHLSAHRSDGQPVGAKAGHALLQSSHDGGEPLHGLVSGPLDRTQRVLCRGVERCCSAQR